MTHEDLKRAEEAVREMRAWEAFTWKRSVEWVDAIEPLIAENKRLLKMEETINSAVWKRWQSGETGWAEVARLQGEVKRLWAEVKEWQIEAEGRGRHDWPSSGERGQPV